MKNKISCIIPAYNEENRIKNVLTVVLNSTIIDEIIVINDGSEDNTAYVIKSLLKNNNFTFIDLPNNKGKSNAVYEGLKIVKNDYIMFLDSDLIGLTQSNLVSLATPIIKGLTEVSIVLFGNTPFLWKIIGIDYICGLRVFNKNIIPNLEEIKTLPGFGLEVFFNKHIINNLLKIKVIEWGNVTSPYKATKINNLLAGIKADIKMMKEIKNVIGISGMFKQIINMLKLK